MCLLTYRIWGPENAHDSVCVCVCALGLDPRALHLSVGVLPLSYFSVVLWFSLWKSGCGSCFTSQCMPRYFVFKCESKLVFGSCLGFLYWDQVCWLFCSRLHYSESLCFYTWAHICAHSPTNPCIEKIFHFDYRLSIFRVLLIFALYILILYCQVHSVLDFSYDLGLLL